MFIISFRCSSDLKEVVVRTTYSCWSGTCHRLHPHHTETDSLVELEMTNSIEWRPRGQVLTPQLQAVYVSLSAYVDPIVYLTFQLIVA
jgi:hypothetical protein